MHIACPYCQKSFDAQFVQAGALVQCPHCGQSVAMNAQPVAPRASAPPKKGRGMSAGSCIAIGCLSLVALANRTRARLSGRWEEVSHDDRYRRCDYAYRYICLILDIEVEYDDGAGTMAPAHACDASSRRPSSSRSPMAACERSGPAADRSEPIAVE